jgi:hypothetical protein
MFKIRVLRKIFGPKRDEVTGDWNKLHIEELRDLYFSINVIRVIKSRIVKWAGHVGGSYRVLVGKPEGTRPLGRRRQRLEENIKVDFPDMGYGGLD